VRMCGCADMPMCECADVERYPLADFHCLCSLQQVQL
jgi:hypothetical protein